MTKDFIEGFAIGIVSGGIAVWLVVLVWFALERMAERFQTIRLYLKLYQHLKENEERARQGLPQKPMPSPE